MIVRRATKGVWVTVAPVTRDEFATLFVRRGRYADSAGWDELFWARTAGAPGPADQVLQRIGYSWPARRRSVRFVSWFEADLFARSVGGRLPWSTEWAAWSEELPSRPPPKPGPWKIFTESKPERPPPEGPSRELLHELRKYYDTKESRALNGFVIEPALSEWCGDYYHATLAGPELPPDPYERRRTFTAGSYAEHRGAAAHHRAANLGFRVVFEDINSYTLTRLGAEWCHLGMRGTDG